MFPLKDNIPTDRTAIITIALIVINVIVYFVLQKGGWSGGPDNITVDWGAIPYEFSHLGQDCVAVRHQVACGTPHELTSAFGTVPDQPPVWVTALRT